MNAKNIFIILTFNLLNVFSIGSNLVTVNLRSPNHGKINWSKYKYIIISNKSSKDKGIVWGEEIRKIYSNENNICVIASVPEWMLVTPGSKILIKKAISSHEDNIPIFIDWKNKFSIENDISIYPTVLILKKNIDNSIKIDKSFSGKFKKKYL